MVKTTLEEIDRGEGREPRKGIARRIHCTHRAPKATTATKATPPAKRGRPKGSVAKKDSLIGEVKPKKEKYVPVPEPPPLERAGPQTYPRMTQDDLTQMLGEYLKSQKFEARERRLNMYRSWLAT